MDKQEDITIQGRLKVLTTSLGEVPYIEKPRCTYRAHYAKVMFDSTSRPRGLFRVVEEISSDYREIEIRLRKGVTGDYADWILEFKPTDSILKNNQKDKLLIRLVDDLIAEVTCLKETGR